MFLLSLLHNKKVVLVIYNIKRPSRFFYLDLLPLLFGSFEESDGEPREISIHFSALIPSSALDCEISIYGCMNQMNHNSVLELRSLFSALYPSDCKYKQCFFHTDPAI